MTVQGTCVKPQKDAAESVVYVREVWAVSDLLGNDEVVGLSKDTSLPLKKRLDTLLCRYISAIETIQTSLIATPSHLTPIKKKAVSSLFFWPYNPKNICHRSIAQTRLTE